MNRFKFNARVKEFPFIYETVMRRMVGHERELLDCDSIRIAKVTKEELKRVPYTYSWSGSLVGIEKWECVDFVLEDGTIIQNAVKSFGEQGSNYAHSQRRVWSGESILEAILGLNVESTLKYIVWSEGGYNVVEHYSEPNFRATIYKPSKEFTWQQVIDETQKEADVETKAEANF